jgi:hypothetical protein
MSNFKKAEDSSDEFSDVSFSLEEIMTNNEEVQQVEEQECVKSLNGWKDDYIDAKVLRRASIIYHKSKKIPIADAEKIMKQNPDLCKEWSKR